MPLKPTFKIGDKVRFNDEYWSTVELFGRDWCDQNAEYTISAVADISRAEDRTSAGHHQHVDLKEDPRKAMSYPRWSGAFFEPVGAPVEA